MGFIYESADDTYFTIYEDNSDAQNENLYLHFPKNVKSNTTYTQDDNTPSGGFCFSYESKKDGIQGSDGDLSLAQPFTLNVTKWEDGEVKGTFHGTLAGGAVITEGKFGGKY